MGFAQYIGKGSSAGSLTDTVNVPYPAGLQYGDLIYMAVINWQGAGTVGEINTPSGWKKEAGGFIQLGGSTNVGYGALFSKRAIGSESGSVAVTRGGSLNGTTYSIAGIMYNFRDIVLRTESANFQTGGAEDQTITWGAVSVGGSERTLAAFLGAIKGGEDTTLTGAPSGYTQEANDIDGPGIDLEFTLFTKENVSSDGVATTMFVEPFSQGFFTVHLSIQNAGAARSFIVN